MLDGCNEYNGYAKQQPKYTLNMVSRWLNALDYDSMLVWCTYTKPNV